MKPIATASALLVICLNVSSAEPAGIIEGRVTLTDPPRAEARIDLKSHPKIEDLHPNGLVTRRYEVGEDGGLKNALVYLRGDFPDAKFEPLEKPVTLEHAKGLFQPYVSGVQMGQPLELRNSDRCTFHTVAAVNKTFNYSGTAVCRFNSAEVPVKFKCDLHPWNFAYVGVFSHPFFTTTDNDGRFKIGEVPPGRHALEMFHPATGKLTKEVLVEEQKTVKMDFSVKPK